MTFKNLGGRARFFIVVLEYIIHMKRKFILPIILLILAAAAFALITIQKEKQNRVCFNNDCFLVELARTPEERSQGLMFREGLASDQGMLFIFEQEGEYPFWMKNTLIPLDIIWLNKEKVIVFIKENVQPCQGEFCPLIDPYQNAKYALEVKEGVAEKINLKIGQKANFEFSK